MIKALSQAIHSPILAAFRYRNYRLYWLGQFSSVLAQSMEIIAQGWLVLELTGSPLMLGLTGLAYSVPRVGLTLVGGAVADRVKRRRIMIFIQAIVAFLFFVLANLIVAEMVRMWHVMSIAFLSGSLRTFDRPSRAALLPAMVPREEIGSAVAASGTIWQFNRLFGPALAGGLIYTSGVGLTYYFCFLVSLAAVVLWLPIRIEQQILAAGESGLVQHMLGGLSYIRHNEIFAVLISMTLFNSLFGMSYLILMPVFARDILLVGSRGYGFLQSVGGGGALLGAFVAAYLAYSQRQGRQVLFSSLIFGALLIGFSLSPWYALSLVLVFIINIANQLYITLINTILQLKLPDELRGRVMGIYGLTWDLMPLGGMIAGAIAEYHGVPVAVLIGGGMVFTLSLVLRARLLRVDR